MSRSGDSLGSEPRLPLGEFAGADNFPGPRGGGASSGAACGGVAAAAAAGWRDDGGGAQAGPGCGDDDDDAIDIAAIAEARGAAAVPPLLHVPSGPYEGGHLVRADARTPARGALEAPEPASEQAAALDAIRAAAALTAAAARAVDALGAGVRALLLGCGAGAARCGVAARDVLKGAGGMMRGGSRRRRGVHAVRARAHRPRVAVLLVDFQFRGLASRWW